MRASARATVPLLWHVRLPLERPALAVFAVLSVASALGAVARMADAPALRRREAERVSGAIGHTWGPTCHTRANTAKCLVSNGGDRVACDSLALSRRGADGTPEDPSFRKRE